MRQPPVLEEPAAVGLEVAEDVEVTDLPEQSLGRLVLDLVDGRDERLEHDPVDVNAGGQQEVVLCGVERIERVAVSAARRSRRARPLITCFSRHSNSDRW